MTANQINYLNYLEAVRHNQATEQLTGLDVQTRQLAQTETVRSNLASEDIRRQTNAINMLNAQAALSQASAAWYNAETNRRAMINNYDIANRQTNIENYKANNLAGLQVAQREQAEANAHSLKVQANEAALNGVANRLYTNTQTQYQALINDDYAVDKMYQRETWSAEQFQRRMTGLGSFLGGAGGMIGGTARAAGTLNSSSQGSISTPRTFISDYAR